MKKTFLAISVEDVALSPSQQHQLKLSLDETHLTTQPRVPPGAAGHTAKRLPPALPLEVIFWGAGAIREEIAPPCAATTLCWEQDSLHTPLYCAPNVLTPSRNPDLLLLYLHKQNSVNPLPISVLHIPQASPLLAYFRQGEMVSKSQMLNWELLRCCEKYKCEWPCQPGCTAQTVSGHIAQSSNVTDYCVSTDNVL